MSEGLEIEVDQHDAFGKRVGVLAAVLAVLLSIFTINAHRAHTETIVLQNEANDQWAYYQGKKIRDYQIEMNLDLLKLLAPSNPQSAQIITAYNTKRATYAKELTDIKKEAEKKVEESALSHKKALRFDFAEGMLEISLIMSSLYFISRKKLFPAFGIFFGIIGAVMGCLGFLL
jgi:hypothetical protein